MLTVRDERKIKRRREVMGLSFVCIIIIIILERWCRVIVGGNLWKCEREREIKRKDILGRERNRTTHARHE